MSAGRKIVLDTNVLIDAFVRGNDIRNRSSAELLRWIDRGEYRGVLPTPVLVETYYVVIDITKDPQRARKVLRVMLNAPNMEVVSIEKKHALQAMEYYREVNYFPLGSEGKLGKRDEGLSMVDALILAVGKIMPDSVVCSNEGKFRSVREVTVKRPWELVDILIEEKTE